MSFDTASKNQLIVGRVAKRKPGDMHGASKWHVNVTNLTRSFITLIKHGKLPNSTDVVSPGWTAVGARGEPPSTPTTLAIPLCYLLYESCPAYGNPIGIPCKGDCYSVAFRNCPARVLKMR